MILIGDRHSSAIRRRSSFFKKGKSMNNKKNKFEPLSLVSFFMVLIVHGSSMGSEPYAGYNFYANGNTCYLKDMKGSLVHKWKSDYNVMSHAYLLRDSSVLFPYTQNGSTINIPQAGGGFQIIKWDGSLAWDFSYSATNYVPHHDCDFYYSTKNPSELPTIIAIVATKENTDGRISEKIVEIKPSGPTTANVVWQWFAYDHSTSSGTDKPELLDLNKGGESGSGGKGGGGGGKEWLHANSVHLNPALNQLVIGSNYFNEFIIIDHSTTTAQAASHSGGKYGKGGDVLYRWGNPSNYGCTGTQYLSRPHSACWVPQFMPGTRTALPGAGHILTISNNTEKAYEIVLPASDGVYPRTTGKAFEPATPLFTFSIIGQGSDQGSIQRLPNGNTLVCHGVSIGSVEFDSAGDTVWSMAVSANELYRYDFSYLGSMLLDTGGVTTVKSNTQTPYKSDALSPISLKELRDRREVVVTNNSTSPMELMICSASGRQLLRKAVRENIFIWNTINQPQGLYLFKITSNKSSCVKKMYLY
jgi:hypothetical protein